MKASTFSLCLLLAASSTAFADDWPMFRGPHRDDNSKETGLLKQWPGEGPKRLWINDKLGLGYSGFAVVKGAIYVLGAREGVETLIALDAKTGVEKWASEIGPMLENPWGNGPRSTPTVDGDKIYAMSGKGELICANSGDGKILWKVNMSDFGGKTPGWGYTESPIVDGNNVICTPGGGQGTLVALDKSTGAKVWQSTDWTDGAQYSSPVIEDIAGNHECIQLTMQSLGAVDANTGKLMWKTPFPGKTAVIPTPIYKDGQVFVSAGYGVGCIAYNVSSGNSISLIYANNALENHHGGVVLVGDYLYGYSNKGGWTCEEWKTGAVKWAEKKQLGKGALTSADGMLYLLDEKTGNVALIEASPDGWKEHGRFRLEPQTTQRSPKGGIWTHPVISNGKLYLRDQEYLYCFDVKAPA